MAAGEDGARVSMRCAQPRPWAGACGVEGAYKDVDGGPDGCVSGFNSAEAAHLESTETRHTHTDSGKKPERSEPVSHPCHLLFRTEKLHSTGKTSLCVSVSWENPRLGCKLIIWIYSQTSDGRFDAALHEVTDKNKFPLPYV